MAREIQQVIRLDKSHGLPLRCDLRPGNQQGFGMLFLEMPDQVGFGLLRDSAAAANDEYFKAPNLF